MRDGSAGSTIVLISSRGIMRDGITKSFRVVEFRAQGSEAVRSIEIVSDA